MTKALGELSSAHYVLLTTYRKDGTPIGTPVWAVARDGKLYVWTDLDSWKVKRIRNNPAVTVQPCGIRGVPRGEIHTATARLLDREGTGQVLSMILRKYWLAGPPTALASRLFHGKDSTIGIELTLQ